MADERKDLQDVVRELAEELSEKATRSRNGETDREQLNRELEELERLKRLLATRESLQPPHRRKRWPLVAIFGTTLVVMSVLLFGRVSEMEIELDLIATGVGFRLDAEQALFDGTLLLSELTISGIREIRLPPTPEEGIHNIPAPSVHIAAQDDPESAISLDLSLPEGTVAEAGALDEQYRVTLGEGAPPFRASLRNRVLFSPHQQPDRSYQWPVSRAVTFYPDESLVHLDFAFVGNEPVAFAPQLTVDSLSLIRFERYFEAALPATRAVSTIEQGTLYLQELNGKSYPLRSGERLQLGGFSGVIRSLDFVDGGLALQAQGVVDAISSGIGNTRRNLMPSYLEWLSARQGLLLLWGACLYIFGLIAGVLRWWGISW